MKTRNIYKSIALMALALTTAACQNELKEETNQPQPGEKITMTIRATQGTAPQTRTIYEDKLETTGIEKVLVKWNGTSKEKILVFGFAAGADALGTSAQFTSTPSTISTDGSSIDFIGEIGTYGNYLAIYPTGGIADAGGFLTSFRGQSQDCTNPMAHLKDYDLMVGTPATTGKYDNFTFEHKATMLRFDLKLPTEEVITMVSLSSTQQLYYTMFTSISGGVEQCQADEDVGSETESLDLFINRHSSSKELKAYMMMPPPLDSQKGAATLTVTVSTQSGAIYEGKLNLADYQLLKAGLCHTLVPTLTLNTTITVPTITAGGLGNALNSIIPAAGQTELVLKSNGAINSNDHNVLKAFLQRTGTNITTLDLSGLNYPNETVVNLTGCTNLKEVILPVGATAIGDDAFSGCTSLAKVSQAEPLTRASISSRMKTIGKSAFKGTAIDVMYLHANITTIGDNAFMDCTELKNLVFEGIKSVGTAAGTDIVVIGADIISGTHSDIKILLPNMKEADKAKATTYKTALKKPTYYNYKFDDYATTTDETKKLNAKDNYTLLPNDPIVTAPGLPGGATMGDTPASGE